MTKIKFIIALIFLQATAVLFAKSNIGVDYYLLGDYEKAKEYFQKNKTSLDPAGLNFYLGEIAFLQGNKDEASKCYNKGLSADPENAQNQIGLAQLNLKTDAKSAENAFNTILKKYKKDINVILTIGRAYLNNGMFKQAMNQVLKAKEINTKTPEIYILEGDILASADNGQKIGDAAGKYEMANYFDPNFSLGYIKTALIYENRNPPQAISKLKTIVEKQPDYIIAYEYLGRIYTQNGFYPQAIDAYKTYFKSETASVDDIEKYARALYFTNNTDDALKAVNEGLAKDPNHFVLNRYLMYIYSKNKNTEKGLAEADKFFSLKEPSPGYIAEDYDRYASLLSDAGRYDEAVVQYDKAISMDPGRMDTYTEAAEMARTQKDYAQAAYFVKKQMDKKAGDNPNNDDYLSDVTTLGYDYYSAGISISKNQPLAEKLMKNNNVIKELTTANKTLNAADLSMKADYFTENYALFCLNKADSIFDIVIRRAPDSYTGYRYKALTLYAINPDMSTGLAKPYYDKVVEIVTGKEATASNKKILLEAYNYLGYYYYMKGDKPNTILYWTKVLEIDPENKNAKLVLDDMKKQK